MYSTTGNSFHYLLLLSFSCDSFCGGGRRPQLQGQSQMKWIYMTAMAGCNTRTSSRLNNQDSHAIMSPTRPRGDDTVFRSLFPANCWPKPEATRVASRSTMRNWNKLRSANKYYRVWYHHCWPHPLKAPQMGSGRKQSPPRRRLSPQPSRRLPTCLVSQTWKHQLSVSSRCAGQALQGTAACLVCTGTTDRQQSDGRCAAGARGSAPG